MTGPAYISSAAATARIGDPIAIFLKVQPERVGHGFRSWTVGPDEWCFPYTPDCPCLLFRELYYYIKHHTICCMVRHTLLRTDPGAALRPRRERTHARGETSCLMNKPIACCSMVVKEWRALKTRLHSIIPEPTGANTSTAPIAGSRAGQQ